MENAFPQQTGHKEEGVTSSDQPTARRRSYYCKGSCTYYTYNPRQFLYHRRDDHGEKFNIYECPHCVYASKQIQKLDRHIEGLHTKKNKEKPATSTSSLCGNKSVNRDSSYNLDETVEMSSFIEDDYGELPIVNGDSPSTLEEKQFKKRFYYCKQCEFVTEERFKYSKHLKSHSAGLLKCDSCEYSTNNRSHLDRHLKNHDGIGELKCDMCSFATEARQSLTIHKTWHHGEASMGDIPQPKSPQVTATNTEMYEENMEPMVADPVQMEDENKDTRGERSRPVDAENYIFKNGLWYKRSLKCRFCSYKAAWPSEIKRHELSHESAADNEAGAANKSKQVNCHLCNTLFDSNGSLAKHMNTVHKAAAKSKNLLSVLQKIQKPAGEGDANDGEEKEKQPAENAKSEEDHSHMIGGTLKEPVCKVCGYKAKWISELEKHIRVHTLEKPYPCPYCKHSARWKGDLTRHIQKIHPTKIDEFYEMTGHKRKLPKPHPVQQSDGGANKMVFPGMEQPPEQSESEDAISDDDEPPSELSIEESAPIPFDDEVDESMEIDEDLPPPSNFTPAVPSFEIEHHEDDKVESENKIESLAVVNNVPRMPLANNNNNQQTGSGMTVLKKVKRYLYKCLDCEFTSRTASRFHVHIVQHLNRRPYMCSECGYRSNWEWDITKHIKIKIQRKEGHDSAKVLLVDEAGRKNYEKYKKYKIEVEEEVAVDKLPALEQGKKVNRPPQPAASSPAPNDNQTQVKSQVKFAYKCKTCDFRDSSKRAVITHIISHLGRYIIPGCGIVNSKVSVDDPSFREEPYTIITLDQGEEYFKCKICPYKSKRDSYIKFHVNQHQQRPGANYKCHFCPYWVNFRKTLLKHLKLHVSEPNSYLKDVESLLIIETPSNTSDKNETIPLANDSVELSVPKLSVIPAMLNQPPEASASPPPDSNQSAISNLLKRNMEKKKFFCEHCPYESDNRSQYQYHKQFHRPNKPGAHKCRFCSYSVSHLHLLRQHMKVHTMLSNGHDASSDSEGSGKMSPATSYSNYMLSNGGRSFEIATAAMDNKSMEYNPDSTIPSVLIRQGEEMVKMYKCRYCPLVNKRRANVRVHEQMHTKFTESKFVCPLCNYQCNNQGVLTAHIKIHQSAELETVNFSRSDLDESYPKASESPSLKQPSNVPPHLLVSMPTPRQKYRSPSLKCSKCPGYFKSAGDLENHSKFHGINLPFKCHLCDYAARCKPHLHNHLRVHETGPTTQSESLDIKIGDAGIPFSPQSTSTPSVTITAMPMKSSRTGHSNNEHNALLVEEANSGIAQLEGQDLKLACSLCPAKFKATYLMQFHKGLHGSPGSFRCSICDYAVAVAKNMAIHGKLHSEFENASSMELHALKPYKCPKCPASFNKTARFQRHVSLHGAKNRHQCDQCDYSVKYLTNLIKHKEVHHTAALRSDENLQFDGASKANLKNGPKSITPLQQQQLNKEWLHESVNHVILEDIDPKCRLFRCNRCPYIHARKDAVQNHLRRHVANQGLCCHHCDYFTMHTCFLRDHMKLHFNSGSWLKPQNFLDFNGIEITATNLSNSKKEVLFTDKGEKSINGRFEPKPQNEFPHFVETNAPVGHDKMQIKQKSMEITEIIIPENDTSIETYIEPHPVKFNGISRPPAPKLEFPRIKSEPPILEPKEQLPKFKSEDYIQQIRNLYESNEVNTPPNRDYEQAMQNVESLGYEDMLQAIDKFMKDDYVPVKDRAEEGMDDEEEDEGDDEDTPMDDMPSETQT